MKFVRSFPCLLFLFSTLLNSFCAVVHGIVQDPKGEPIFNASVSVQNGSFSSHLQTGANGEFAFDVPSGLCLISASAYFSFANEWVPTERELVICNDDLEVVLQLDKLDLSRKITGHVTGPGGGLGDWAQISASRQIQYSFTTITTNTDFLGHFSLPVSPGNWRVTVSPSSGYYGLNVSRTVAVSEDEDSNVEIVIQPQESWVTFSIIDEASNAVSSAYVSFWAVKDGTDYSTTVQSDASGYCAASLFSGIWELSVYDWSGRSAWQTIFVSGFGSNFVLIVKPSPWVNASPASAPWGGYVQDETGVFLTNFAIGDGMGVEANTDAQGDFIFDTKVGYHSFSISDTNFIAPRGFWVAEHSPETNVQVILHHSDSVVDVKITDEVGSEIVGAIVNAATYTNGWLYTQDGITDCDGRAALRLFAGQWIIHAQTPDRTNRQPRKISRQVSIPTGLSDLSLEIGATPRMAFYSKLIDENGKRFSSDDLTVYGPNAGLTPLRVSSPVQLAPGRWHLGDRLAESEGYIAPSLHFDFVPATIETNITLVRKRGTNIVLARVADSQATEGFTISASTFLHGTNYTTAARSFGTNHCALRLFEGNWQFSASPTHFFDGSYTLKSTNYYISGPTSEVSMSMPVVFPYSNPTNMALVRGRVVDESNSAWPFVDVNNCPTRSDGSFSLMAEQIWVNHPLYLFSMSFWDAGELAYDDDVTLVMPRNLHAVDFGLMDSNTNALPIELIGFSDSGITNYQAQNWMKADGRSLLFLAPGRWTFYCWGQEQLNALGYQSFNGFDANITGPTNITLFAKLLTADSRRPRMNLSHSPSGMALTFRSETASTYLIQRTLDFRAWHPIETIRTGGETITLPFSAPSSNSFYRAIWLQDGTY